MVDRIETPRQFFDFVVEDDVRDFLTDSLDLRAAYHACASLLSLRDWIFKVYNGKPWSSAGAPLSPFTTIFQLQIALERLDSRVAILTDVANASEHMILDRRKSRTNLYGSANTARQSIHSGAISGGAISAAPVSGASEYIAVKIDDKFHDVKDCVAAVHNLWRGLLAENAW